MSPAVLAMFALWVGYGVVQWRRSGPLLSRMNAIPRERRPGLATLWLIGGAAILLAALYATNSFGGFTNGALQPWAWPICALAGLGFVHAQVSAGAMLVSMAVTSGPRQPSQSEEGNP